MAEGSLSGHASPVVAVRWLDQWRTIGGGITIDKAGRVCPWRFIEVAAVDPGAERARDLMQEMDTTPGLKAAMRVIVSSEATLRSQRIMKEAHYGR